MNPEKIRPLDGWCVVKVEQRPENIRGILLPVAETTAEKLDKGAGSIVRIGSGKKNDPLGLTAGARIVFRSFLKHANPVESDGGGKYFLIATSDILGEIAQGIDVGVYSKENSNG